VDFVHGLFTGAVVAMIERNGHDRRAPQASGVTHHDVPGGRGACKGSRNADRKQDSSSFLVIVDKMISFL